MREPQEGDRRHYKINPDAPPKEWKFIKQEFRQGKWENWNEDTCDETASLDAQTDTAA